MARFVLLVVYIVVVSDLDLQCMDQVHQCATVVGCVMSSVGTNGG